MENEDSPLIIKELKVIDNLDEPNIILKHCNSIGIGPTKLSVFFHKGLSKTMNNSHGLPWPSYSFRCQAIYAELDGNIIGAVFFEHTPERRQVYIPLSYIEHRTKGLHNTMQEELVKISKSLGVIEINCFIHVTNEIALKAAKISSFKPTYYKMVKKI